jgi:uncharacterized protein
MKKTLIIFAKAPKPGQVKTRLEPDLLPEEACRLYEAFVIDILRATERLRGVTRIVGCTPAQNASFFRSLADRYHVRLMDQQGGDLGERMQKAFEVTYHQGPGPVAIIGTDSPTLPMEFVQEAFTLLRDHELVLGPSHDGGYYLVGCRKNIPPIFEGIPWGSDEVFAMTLKRAVDLKLKCALLPFWYDVDTLSDLKLLAEHLRYLEQRGAVNVAWETSRILKTFDG